MQTYRVSIWTSVDVEAGNKAIAEEIAKDMLINGEIKNRDFSAEAEEIE
jgi:uncharacterized membrane protein